MQRGVANGLKVLCLFMITEVSIGLRCQKKPGRWYRPYAVYPPNTPLGIDTKQNCVTVTLCIRKNLEIFLGSKYMCFYTVSQKGSPKF